MKLKRSWKNICFSQKNWNDWKTIKLFLFENDACFRDKTLINCKQIIIHCEFMSNKTIIKIYNMSCETKSSTKKTIFFSIWLNDSFMFSYEFFKTINLYSYKSLKKFKSLKLITKFLSNFHNSFQEFEIFNKNLQFIEKFINESFNFFFNRTSSYRAFIYVNLNFRKLLLKHFRTRQISLLKLIKFERWITLRFIIFVDN